MGIIDPEIEAFETEVIQSWLEDIDLEKTPQAQALIGKGVELGIEQGRAQGVEQGLERVAAKMIAAGKSDEEIVKLTELPLETIHKLREKQR